MAIVHHAALDRQNPETVSMEASLRLVFLPAARARGLMKMGDPVSGRPRRYRCSWVA